MPADVTALVRILSTLGRVDTREALIAWTENDLQALLPHRAFICGMGKIHRAGASPIHLVASNFPIEYLLALKAPSGHYTSRIMKNWLASGTVQCFDVAHAEDSGLDPDWIARFKASGLQNLIAHGVRDVTRRHASYFSFHRIPGTLDETYRRVVELIVPHMHTALLRIVHKQDTRPHVPRRDASLTPRELEVLHWLCAGKTSPEIAAILGISPNTVRNQTQSILGKLHVTSRAQAAAKAIKSGLIATDSASSRF